MVCGTEISNGTFIISDPAYGYCKDPDGNLIIEPKEAAVVRRILKHIWGEWVPIQLLRAYRRRESLLAGSQMDGRREPSKKFLKSGLRRGSAFTEDLYYRRYTI